MTRPLTLLITIAFVFSACGGEDTSENTQDGSTEGGSQVEGIVYPDPTVTYLQQALNDLGYEPGPVDGFYGPATTAAVIQFQTDQGLESTGALDNDTVNSIDEQYAADEHLLVESIQTQLTELGLYADPIDGLWGADTEEAITSFQSESGLGSSGSLDDQTFVALSVAYHEEVVGSHRDAATETGVGGEVHDTAATVPADGGDDFIRQGDDGDQVVEIQTRLAELGYRPGTADGDFGAATASAVLAFQKREGLQRDAIVGPDVLERLDSPQGAGPRSDSTGPRVEVDLDRQILFVIGADGGVTTLNTSTGSGKEFQSAEPGKGIVVAHTPVGEFEILRVIDGNREAPLGTLYRPMYFTNEGGFAIHGNPNVPAYPASHGCARLANWDMDFLWDTGLDVGDAVWVYGDNPPAPDNAAGGF